MTDINTNNIKYRLFKENFEIDGSLISNSISYKVIIMIISKPDKKRPDYKNVLFFFRKSDGKLLNKEELISLKNILKDYSMNSSIRIINYSLKNNNNNKILDILGLNNKNINNNIIKIPIFYSSLSMDSFLNLFNAIISIANNKILSSFSLAGQI